MACGRSKQTPIRRLWSRSATTWACRARRAPPMSVRLQRNRETASKRRPANCATIFCRDLAERHGARYLVTGHTADDQAETILHRIVRGTGLRGLAGMPRARSLSPAVSLLRPLLTLSRSAVHAYLAAIEQPYCSDESNCDPAFTRNRIRNQLLPLIQEEFNPQAIPAILRLGQLAGDVQQLVDQLAERQLTDCIAHASAECISLDCDRLRDVPDYLIRELLIQIWRDQDWPLQGMGHRTNGHRSLQWCNAKPLPPRPCRVVCWQKKRTGSSR